MEDSADGLTSIVYLSGDCLSIIFQHLGCSLDRESFGLTCRRWLHIQNLNRRSLQFQCSFSILNPQALLRTPVGVTPDHLSRLLFRFPYLEHLSLSGCVELPDSGLACLLDYGSRLQTLYMDCCFRITDNGLSMVFIGCPSLAAISLYRCNISDDGLEILANACFSLKRVNLSWCLDVSDLGLRALSEKCRQLQAVKISNCSRISSVGFRGCSRTLTYIDAECCNLGSDGIIDIVSGHGLEFLNISGLNMLYGYEVAAIGNGFGTRLKTLNLRMCRTIGNESIIAIANGCPLLQEWNLALCHGVSLPGWESIGSNCRNLEKLHVCRCRNLCDRGLQALRDGCRKLSVLYMLRNVKLSVAAAELFKLYRCDVTIKREEVMFVGPDWTT